MVIETVENVCVIKSKDGKYVSKVGGKGWHLSDDINDAERTATTKQANQIISIYRKLTGDRKTRFDIENKRFRISSDSSRTGFVSDDTKNGLFVAD